MRSPRWSLPLAILAYSREGMPLVQPEFGGRPDDHASRPLFRTSMRGEHRLLAEASSSLRRAATGSFRLGRHRARRDTWWTRSQEQWQFVRWKPFSAPSSKQEQRRDYLDNPLRIGAILGAFFLLTVPLCVLRCRNPGRRTDALSATYVVALGFTHFALTWTLYLRSANREYFCSSRRNAALYVALPPAFIVLFAALGYLDIHALPSETPTMRKQSAPYVLPYSIVLKAADYYHVVRQSFGVLQLLKAKTPLPAWQRRLENYFFLGMALLQIHAFVRDLPAGSVPERQREQFDRIAALLFAVPALLFLIVSANFIITAALNRRNRANTLISFLYFVLQSISSAIVVYRPSLYRYALAMHYVEYHILMVPRCFDADLDLERRSDRLVAWLRQHKAAFYLGLLGVAAWIGSDLLLELFGIRLTKSQKLGRFMVNATNGIFVSHYFVEAFVWKFGNPFYRGQLRPLYFGRTPLAAPPEVEPPGAHNDGKPSSEAVSEPQSL